MRIATYKDNSARARQRRSRLKKRAVALQNFYGTILATMYGAIGLNPAEVLVLPWLDLNELYKLSSTTLHFPEFIEALEGLPFVKLNRKEINKPLVRLTAR